MHLLCMFEPLWRAKPIKLSQAGCCDCGLNAWNFDSHISLILSFQVRLLGYISHPYEAITSTLILYVSRDSAWILGKCRSLVPAGSFIEVGIAYLFLDKNSRRTVWENPFFEAITGWVSVAIRCLQRNMVKFGRLRPFLVLLEIQHIYH